MWRSVGPSLMTARRTVVAVALLGTSAAVLAGCSSSPSASSTSTTTATTAGPPAAPAVGTASASGVGTVLVNGAGDTLYLFVPDSQDGSTCSASCASAWPPYLLPAGVTAARATGGAKASMLGTVQRSDGRLQVTYNRWPLYTWIGDTSPGVATGENLDQFGGFWYAVNADGVAVKP